MRDARPFRNLEIDEGPEALPVAEQLAHALRKHAGKILDLFRTWDADGDGGVTLAEFIKAMHSLGLERKLAKSLFRDWDKTSDGALSFRELQRILTTQAGSKAVVQIKGVVGQKYGRALTLEDEMSPFLHGIASNF